MKNYHLLLALLLIFLFTVSAVGFVAFKKPVNPSLQTPQKQPLVTNFNECADAGYPILESYPRKCRANGETFSENINQNRSDLIYVDNPQPGQKVASPLEITGAARGSWFFEATFPVILTDSAGNELANAPAKAQGDWMTEDFVSFTATLIFDTPTSATGELILQKDNPSGLPENADELKIPVNF